MKQNLQSNSYHEGFNKQKLQNEFLIDPDHTIELKCAAEGRSAVSDESVNGKTTSIYDLEIFINDNIKNEEDPQSVVAINCKFTYLEGQSFKMSPECEHDNPYLFVISKETLMEMLISTKKGKDRIYINDESSIVTVQNMLENIIMMDKNDQHIITPVLIELSNKIE